MEQRRKHGHAATGKQANPMTPTELTELDRLLATGVMKWSAQDCSVCHTDDHVQWHDAEGDFISFCNAWHPTTDIAQAMMVAQRISDKGWIVLTLTYEHHERVPQGCVIIKGCAAPFPLPEIVKHPVYFDEAIFQQSETLPLAICLAARAWLEAAAQPTAPRE